jgi:elongation factor P--beta-lysine ligase
MYVCVWCVSTGERMLTALHTSVLSHYGEDAGKRWLRNVLKMAMKVLLCHSYE